ncbi:MAG: hypothetical protein ACW985_00770 [Candidatus Thorarchaeota archaeon]|jgi:hypothetical protein
MEVQMHELGLSTEEIPPARGNPMKRMLLPLIFIVLLIIPYTGDNNAIVRTDPEASGNRVMDMNLLSSAGGSGSDENSVLYMSRELTEIQTSILNTYDAPAKHNGTLDLGQYQISGWTLFRADLDVENITAAPERETVGIPSSPGTDFVVEEYTADFYYAMLAQGFYNQAHDGSLVNYSIEYITLNYDIASRGTPYILIVSDYTDNSSGITTPTVMPEHGSWNWITTSGENIILSASTVYYTYINGSDLHEDTGPLFEYPKIYWHNQDSAGTFATARWSTEFMAWSSPSLEGLINYTYVPWNTVGGAAFVYGSPTDIAMRANSSTLSGSSWTFNAVGNLTSIEFDSDQSVYINQNLTLWYQKTVTTTNTWDVQDSGDTIDWNATTVVAYPSVSGTVSRYANVTVGGDWTVSGLYDSASPSVDYGNYVDYGTYISCSNIYDETWTLVFTGHNHVTSMAAYDMAVNSSVINILSTVDVNASIEQSDSSPVTTGNANLTIWHDGAIIQPPQVNPVSDGTFSYAWDISATTLDNGTYSLLLIWTSGNEAGYREIPVLVYFPTTLTAASNYIEGYADSTVDISVYFNETFSPKALDGTYASVDYSFGGGPNTAMTDHANGTWTASIDTTGKTIGFYSVIINGQGFAIENATEVITIAIVDATSSLIISWVENNTITFIQRTNLTVVYEFSNSTRVSDAILNVTDGSMTWPLAWDSGTGTYWKEFTGSDFGGPGVYPLTVSAWKLGVETQVNNTLSITIFSESTILTPSWTNSTFDYSEIAIFSVNYTDHLGTLIPGAEVRDISINGSGYVLNDAGNGTYWFELTGVYDLGNHTVSVLIGKTGYQFASDSGIWFYIAVANTNVEATPAISPMQVYYTHNDTLTITLSDDEGDPINTATVELEYNGMNHTVEYDSPGVYIITINGTDGLGSYPIRIFTYTYGFNDTIDVGQIDIVETATSLYADGTRVNGPYTILYNDGSITFNVLYEDIDLVPLTTGIVNITINSITYGLSAGVFNYTLTLTAWEIGIGIYNATIRADLFGYDGATIYYLFEVEAVPTHIESTSSVPSVMHLNQTIVFNVRYWDNNSGSWLLPDNSTFIWSNSLSPTPPDGSGWHQITLSSDSLSIGQHLLNITFKSTNYTAASITILITVRVVNTDFYVIGTYSTHENETVRLRVFYHDQDHDASISWANVVATLEGTDYPMTYDGASVYIADIRADLDFGSYQFSISASATGCASNSTTASLTLSEKHHVYIDLLEVLRPVEGESTSIAALVQYNNSVQTELLPLVSASVNFLVTIGLSNGTVLTWSHTDTTDNEGVASYSFQVPTTGDPKISNMTVDAWYDGTSQRWSARADTLPVEVDFNPLQEIVRFLTSDLGLIIMLSFIVLGSVAVGYNKKFKPKKREARRGLMRQLDSFKELETLQHFMAVYIDRGTCVFYHPFRDSRIQPDLISGFIAAITSVYGEIKGNGVQGSLEEINYQGLRLNSYSGKFIIGIVIVEGDMSARLRDRLQFFVELFEDQYHADLDGWTGLVDCFDPEWVVSNLNTAFNYSWMLPHQIVRKVRVKGQFAKVLKHIHTKFGDGEFLLLGIVEETAALLGCTDAEAFDVLLRLEDSGAIKPISIHTVLQRQGLGIADEDDASQYETDTQFEPEDIEIVKKPVVEEITEPEPEPIPEPVPEVVDAPEPEPVKEEKVEKVSEEDKFLADVLDLMEEEEKEKKGKKKG